MPGSASAVTALVLCRLVVWTAAPGSVDVVLIRESLNIRVWSGTVTSQQVMGFPLVHVRSEVPSGHLLTDWQWLTGSLTVGA